MREAMKYILDNKSPDHNATHMYQATFYLFLFSLLNSFILLSVSFFLLFVKDRIFQL